MQGGFAQFEPAHVQPAEEGRLQRLLTPTALPQGRLEHPHAVLFGHHLDAADARQGRCLGSLDRAFQFEEPFRGRLRLGHRALEGLLAPRQQHDLVAQPFGVLHHMGREQHRGAVRRQLPDHRLQPLLVDRIEARKRLIEDHELRPVHYGSDQLDLLGHPLGQLLHLLVLRGAQTLGVQHLARPLASLAGRQALQGTEEGDGVDRGHLLVEAALLRQEADPVAHLAAVVGTENVDAPGAGGLQAKDHAQRRGLAGPVRTQKAADGAFFDLKAQIAHGLEVTVSFAHPFERQRRRHDLSTPCLSDGYRLRCVKVV